MHPLGGHHVWVSSRAVDERALFAEALRQRGGVHARRRDDGGASRTDPMRLSFALVGPESSTRASAASRRRAAVRRMERAPMVAMS